MKRIVLIFSAMACLIAGCSTYGSLEKKEPSYAGTTSKTPEVFAQCVRSKWISEPVGANTHIAKNGDAFEVIFPASSDLMAAILTVTRSREGAEYAERDFASWGPGFDKRMADVLACE